MESFSDLSRRGFLLRSAGTLALSASALSLLGCEKDESSGNPITPNPTGPNSLSLDTATSAYAVLAAPGGAMAVNTTVNGVALKLLVYRKSDSQAICLNRMCTHQGCDMDPRQDGDLSGDKLTCGCHGSQFEVNSGTVVRGPATRNLVSYPVTISGSVLKISFA